MGLPERVCGSDSLWGSFGSYQQKNVHADMCSSLSGKQKLFSFRAMKSEGQLEDSSFLEVDGPSVKKCRIRVRQPGGLQDSIHREADFFWSLCKADVPAGGPSSSPSQGLPCSPRNCGKKGELPSCGGSWPQLFCCQDGRVFPSGC